MPERLHELEGSTRVSAAAFSIQREREKRLCVTDIYVVVAQITVHTVVIMITQHS